MNENKAAQVFCGISLELAGVVVREKTSLDCC